MKRAIYIAATLLASTLSALAINTWQDPIDELNDNPEYVELQRSDRELVKREDSVALVMSEARDRFRIYADSLTSMGLTPSSEDFSAFSDRILELEQQIFDIRTMRGDIIARINELEQEWVLAQMNAPIEEPAEEPVEESVVMPLYRNLIDNHCLKDVLYAEDYAELCVAQAEDAAMDSLVDEYNAIYNRMMHVAERYRTTDNEEEANELFGEFAVLKRRAEAKAEEIESRWNHILDTKYYAYGYILERDRHYDLLDNSSVEFADMRRECSREAGNYATDALMHYALGRPTLRKFESDFARTMGLEEAADSIAALQREPREINYRLEPLHIERRLFIDFQPIAIGRTNFYKETNPIPDLKVYERGTIYRILLGEFRSKQPMTLFKGVQPLYITRNEEGNYLYYAGGFSSRREADEAQLFLKEKGFKSPEICRWQNGAMLNITTVERDNDGSVVVPVSGMRYMIKIVADTLSEELRTIISTEAPRQSVSKEADSFVLGTFDNRDEVEILVSHLAENTSATIEIIEIELNE
jgi:hypothetical protein